MTSHAKKNTSSPSTTWVSRPDRIRKDPAPQAGRAPKAPRWFKLPRRDPRGRLTVTITYRGGSEAWYLIEARGSRGAFPGVLCLHDVMREINGGSSIHWE